MLAPPIRTGFGSVCMPLEPRHSVGPETSGGVEPLPETGITGPVAVRNSWIVDRDEGGTTIVATLLLATAVAVLPRTNVACATLLMSVPGAVVCAAVGEEISVDTGRSSTASTRTSTTRKRAKAGRTVTSA